MNKVFSYMAEKKEFSSEKDEEMIELNENNYVDVVARVINDFLEINRLSYKDLERESGVSSRQIQNLAEKKIANPGGVTVCKIMKAVYRKQYLSGQ